MTLKKKKHLKVRDLTTPSGDNGEAADLSELWLLRLYLDNSSGIRHLKCKWLNMSNSINRS